MEQPYQLISFNKNFIPAADFRLELSNRAFRYGDGFFETMHANGMELQFVEDHFERMQRASRMLKINLPDYFDLPFLKRQVAGLLSRNKLFQAARIKLCIYRTAEGYYIPRGNASDVIIEASYLGKGPYVLNAEGLIVGVYDEMPKPRSTFGSIKSLNAQPYVLAGIFASENAFDDVFLVDEKGCIVEATSSNVFALSGNRLLTPSLQSGCVEGIMRKQIIAIAQGLGYEVNANADLYPDDLLHMDELFLTNAIAGIRYVSAYEKRRFYKKSSYKLVRGLNAQAFANSSPG